jgi:hypothetical protein
MTGIHPYKTKADRFMTAGENNFIGEKVGCDKNRSIGPCGIESHSLSWFDIYYEDFNRSKSISATKFHTQLTSQPKRI